MVFLAISYPFLLHLFIASGYVRSGLWLLLAVSVVYSLRLLGPRKLNPAGLLAPGVAALALVSLFLDDTTVLYLPPIAMAAALLQVFGHTLLPGGEPLICRFARLEGVSDARSLRYARRLTWVWALCFAFILVESLLLALFAPIEVWSLFVNVINYLLIAALFVLEYAFRMVYFRRMPSIQAMKRTLAVFKATSSVEK